MSVKKTVFAVLILSFILSSLIAHPLFASPKEDLVQTQKDMEASRARQAELAQESGRLEAELHKLKEKLVQAAAEIEKNEADTAAAEDKLHRLTDQLQSKNAALKTGRKELASLLQAAVSLSQTPPEAMVMMPGDAMETMQAARALKMVSQAIRQKSEAIARQIGELEELKQQVTQERDELSRRKAVLTQEREALADQLKQRAAMEAKIGREQREEAQKQARLARKAADLKDLIASLRQERAAGNAAGTASGENENNETEAMDGRLRSFAAAMGNIRKPAAGRVVQWFESGHGRTRTSKGIIIAVPSHAQVIAPFDGEVVYAGTFLNYGQMVIIRHRDGFHTLLAGLAKISVTPGEFLLEGEPIGAMGEGETGNRLYVELRKDNQPIDPSPWIKGIAR